MVMEPVQEDTGGEGSLQCSNHPFKATAAGGGICAFCLQEKLDKLVSSSTVTPTAVFPSSSFRSHFSHPNPKSTLSLQPQMPEPNNNRYYSAGSFHRISFFHAQKRKKKKDLVSNPNNLVFRRSMSSAAAPRGGDTPRKTGFWSFLHLSNHNNARKIDTNSRDEMSPNGSLPAAAEDGGESPDAAAAAACRKVSRSRSVGCGSRSFSGDFFERISTGFGDCTLRRVESHREGKHKVTPLHRRRAAGDGIGGEYIKERVKCGGIFGGFLVTSSSSSSSSCLGSSSGDDSNVNGRPPPPRLAHGRSKSWGWAFASPMRGLSKPNISSVKRGKFL